MEIKERAFELSKLFGMFFKRYGSKNQKAFDKWFKKFDVEYNVPVNRKETLLQAILPNIDKNTKVDVVDLSSEFSNAKNFSRKELANHIKSLIDSENITSKDKKAIFSFVSRSKRTGKNNVYVPNHIANSSKVETNFKRERNTSVKNIVNLLQNSILIEKTENKDKYTKPNVDNYLRFYVPVKINNNIFTVRIVAENNEKKDLFNILNADVYDVIIDKKMMTSDTLKNESSNSLMKPSSDYIINDNNDSFNPEKLTIEEMLKGVKDAEGRNYFQSADTAGANNSAEISAANPNIYFQTDISKTINILKDVLSKKDKEKVIELFSSIPLLKPLRNYFNDVLDDVYFQQMPKWMAEREDSSGGYLEFFNKTIYLNYDKIGTYPNKEQQFIRVLLHELMHAKLENAIKYAGKNLNNKQLNEENRQELQEFLNTINISKEDIKKYKDFTKKHNAKDLKKDYELAKECRKAYSYYNNSAIETEVDNVALALQSLLGNSSNRKIRNFGLRAFFNMDLREESQRGKSELQYIRGFNERYNTLHYGYGRLSDFVNTKTYYQNTTNNNNNIVDLTNDFEKTPTIEEVKNYINEIVENGTKFATLSPNWFVDIKGGKRTTKKILNAGNYKNLEKMGRKRHSKYIMSLEKLLANAEYVGEKENTKKDKNLI